MAYQITSESYGRRLPKITATADSTDDLATLGTDWAEGSTCVIGSTTYSLDKVQGWVEPGSGGGGSSLPDIEWTDLTSGSGQLFACRKSGIVFLSNMGSSLDGLSLTELPEQFVPDDGGYGGQIVATVHSTNYAATVTGRLVISGDGSLDYHNAPDQTGGGSLFVSYPAKATSNGNGGGEDDGGLT